MTLKKILRDVQMNIATGNQNGLVSLQKSEVETTRIIIFFLKKKHQKEKKNPSDLLQNFQSHHPHGFTPTQLQPPPPQTFTAKTNNTE